MTTKDDIKAARNSSDLKNVFQKIADSNTDNFNADISPEEMLRTLILLAKEVGRLSDAVAALQVANQAKSLR